MKTSSAILLALGFGLLGILGGLFGVLLTPATYQADAYVVVYAMPTGFTNLISPDEAKTINVYFAAGALQDSVIQRVLGAYPSLTAQEIRQAITVSVIAYTPLTRVTGVADSPDAAVTLANAVANAWVADAGGVIAAAYNEANTALKIHEEQLNKQIAATTAALAPLQPTATKAKALAAQLKTLQDAFTVTDTQLAALQKERYTVAGNTYLATPASAGTVTRSPSLLQALATGGVVGLTLGIVCTLWIIRTSLMARRAVAYLEAPGARASVPLSLSYGPGPTPTRAPSRQTLPPDWSSPDWPSYGR